MCIAARFGYRLNSLVFWMHRSFWILKKNFRVLIGRQKKRKTTPDRLGSCWISISSFRMINGYFVVMLHLFRIDNLCTICSRMPLAFLLRDARHTTHDIFFCTSLQLYTPFRSVKSSWIYCRTSLNVFFVPCYIAYYIFS